jgi:hypothetical protein
VSGSTTRQPYKTVSTAGPSNIFVTTPGVVSREPQRLTCACLGRIEKAPNDTAQRHEAIAPLALAAVAAVAATSVDAVLYAASMGTDVGSVALSDVALSCPWSIFFRFVVFARSGYVSVTIDPLAGAVPGVYLRCGACRHERGPSCPPLPPGCAVVQAHSQSRSLSSHSRSVTRVRTERVRHGSVDVTAALEAGN